MKKNEDISFKEIKAKLYRLGYNIDTEGFLLEDNTRVSFLSNKEFVSIHELETLNMFLNGRHRLKITDDF